MIRLVAFTEKGARLAGELAKALGGRASAPASCPATGVEVLDSLAGWTARGFKDREALVFVCACGIAVRAVAPHVKSKAADPAVVVVDECGAFAVSLLSGHLGGANALARRIAALCGAQAVITTATDRRGVFAVDDWARENGLQVANPAAIKAVSSALLRGEAVGFSSCFPVEGPLPPGLEARAAVSVAVDWAERAAADTLLLIPVAVSLGVGCRRDTAQEEIEQAVERFFSDTGLSPLAVREVCSVTLKASEPGLLSFCARRGWKARFFTPRELAAAKGAFVSSPFVERTVGVDNVCGRAAVCGSGGALLFDKRAYGPVTVAAALENRTLSFPARMRE